MVAVIMPVYNRADCLGYALKSLTMQTDRKFVTIVVDDCSTEDIKSVCDSFRDQLMLVYLKTDVNSGPGIARQVGIDYAAEMRWEYVMFLDGDDAYMPNTVEKLAYEIKHRGDDFVGSAISAQGGLGNPGYTIDPIMNSRIWVHGKIYRTSFLVNNGIRFEEGLRGNEDVCFNIKCYYMTKKKSFLEDNLYLWRNEKTSITRRTYDIEFERIVSIDYIEAVCKALVFLDKKNVKLPRDICNYAFFCYNYYQVALAKDRDLTKTDEYLTQLFSINLVKEAFKRHRVWADNEKFIGRYKIVNKEIIWYKQGFDEWLKKFGIDINQKLI